MPLKICPSYLQQENVAVKININSNRVATPPLKSYKVLSLEKALPFAKKYKYLSKSCNQFWFTPIMKLVLSTLKQMFREKNFKKVTKIFQKLAEIETHEDSKISNLN